MQLNCKENVTSGDLVQEICPYQFLNSSSVSLNYLENIKLPVSWTILCKTLQCHFAMVKITKVTQLTFLRNLLNKSKSTVNIPLIPDAACSGVPTNFKTSSSSQHISLQKWPMEKPIDFYKSLLDENKHKKEAWSCLILQMVWSSIQ